MRVRQSNKSTSTAPCIAFVLFALCICANVFAATAYRFPGDPPEATRLTNDHVHRAKAVQPQKIPLSGGLLHASGFYFNASVGGQHFTLQVDTSYSFMVVPTKGCKGCRVGDRRYDPTKSKTSQTIPCGSKECQGKPQEEPCLSKQCYKCSSSGHCCVEGGDDCAFNVLYGDDSSGNGTLHRDVVQVGDISATVLFGGMHSESHNFELPYADGVFGLAFQKGSCRPTCFPPVMDSVVNQTGLLDVFTICVTWFGGTLVLGAADTALATEPYSYVDVVEDERENRFITAIMSGWKIGDRDINLPDVNKACWSLGVSGVALSKNSFMIILEHLNKFYCNIPGLCSYTSWFRPQSCAPLTDEILSAMPNFTIPLTARVSITLTPEDYLLPFRKVQGKLQRCVAFFATDSLVSKNYDVILGTTVMRRYAVAHDRNGRRVGLAPAKGGGVCGPETGSAEGLPAVPGTGGTMLTADAPAAANAPVVNPQTQEFLTEAEVCRAENSCSGCAKQTNCSYSYVNGRCVPREDARGQPYPFCSGSFCACMAVESSGWYVGIVIGVFLSVVIAAVVFVACRKRSRAEAYQPVDGYQEQDLMNEGTISRFVLLHHKKNETNAVKNPSVVN